MHPQGIWPCSFQHRLLLWINPVNFQGFSTSIVWQRLDSDCHRSYWFIQIGKCWGSSPEFATGGAEYCWSQQVRQNAGRSYTQYKLSEEGAVVYQFIALLHPTVVGFKEWVLLFPGFAHRLQSPKQSIVSYSLSFMHYISWVQIVGEHSRWSRV